MLTYKPRNDFVVVKMTNNPYAGRIAVSQNSPEAFRFHVIAIGPQVTGLDVGNRVYMMGSLKVDYDFMPGTKDLIQIREKMITVIVEGDEEQPQGQAMGPLCQNCRTRYTMTDKDALCPVCLGDPEKTPYVDPPRR
jgi:hypothetical protein